MRFRSQLSDIGTFAKFIASLSSLGKICWMRLEESVVRFTIIPDQGTQAWATLPIETIFDESYHLQSATGVINLEVPIGALSRALRSGIGASSAQLRLTKKGSIPLLALTIVASSWTEGNNALGVESADALDTLDAADVGAFADDMSPQPTKRGGRRAPTGGGRGPRERETVITQEIPVKVLHQSVVEGLHEPRCRDPDVHIVLPSLAQLKAISDRFTKLASASGSVFGASAGGGGGKSGGTLSSSSLGPKLELSANMHGSLKLAIATDALRISSIWTGLLNPNIDVAQMSEAEIAQLPSERMRALGAEANGDEEAGWAKVRIDGKDWGRVLSVGRLSPKVVACFIHETALLLYVYLQGRWAGEESCLTYYVNSYSA